MKGIPSCCQAHVPFRNTPLRAATDIQVEGMCLCGDLPWVGFTEKSQVHSRPGAKLYKSHVVVVVLMLSSFMRQSDSAGEEVPREAKMAGPGPGGGCVCYTNCGTHRRWRQSRQNKPVCS